MFIQRCLFARTLFGALIVGPPLGVSGTLRLGSLLSKVLFDYGFAVVRATLREVNL